jgi:hypothetical protein
VRKEFKVFEVCTRWFKYDRDYLCVNKSQFVPVIFQPPCTICEGGGIDRKLFLIRGIVEKGHVGCNQVLTECSKILLHK